MTTLDGTLREIGRASWSGIETAIIQASCSENIAENYSTVHTRFILQLSQYFSVSSWSLGLDGSGGASGGYTTWQSGNNVILDGSWNVAHNADGTGSVTIHANWSSTYGLTSWTPSISVGLPTIPRASQPTLSTGSIECDGKNSFTISTNRASSSFTHKLTWKFGSLTGNIPSDGSNVDTSVVWTPSTNLLAQIPNASSGSGTIYCTTYSGSTKIGDTKSVAFTLTAKTYVPTLSSTVTEKNTKVGSVDYTVIGISNKLITATVSALMYATISSVVVNVSGTDYSLTKQTNGTYTVTLNSVQSGTYKITVTDSRGLTTTQTITQTEYKYFAPYPTSSSLTRTNPTESTGTLAVAGKWFSEASNTLTATTTIRNTSESTSTTVNATLTTNGDTWKVDADKTILTMLNYKDAFEAVITITDGMGTTVQISVGLAAAECALEVGKDTVIVKGYLLVNGIPVHYTMPSKAISTSSIVANDGNYSSMFPYKFDYSIDWMTADTDNVHVFPASETDFNNLDGCFNGSWSTYDGYLRLYFLKKPSATVNVIVGV